MQLMTKVVAQSVNRIWDEFETSGDGLMEYDEARKFLREVVGTLRDTQYTEQDLKEIWDTIDKDKDGKINKGEMT